MACSVDITKLILVTTIVSTGCSLVGGLYVYFKSLESLEDTVREVSRAEVGSLRKEMSAAFDELRSVMLTTLQFLYSENVLSNGPRNATDRFLGVSDADVIQWSMLTRRLIFQMTQVFKFVQGISFTPIPFDSQDPALWTAELWYDLLADGSKEYVVSLSDQVTEDTNLTHLQVFSLDDKGDIVERVYGYHYDTWQYIEDYDIPETHVVPRKSNTTSRFNFSQWGADHPVPSGYVKSNVSQVLFESWSHPKAWYSSDGNPYVYVTLSYMVRPPPPPHPLSGYNVIQFAGYLVMDSWSALVNEYAAQHDAKVMVVDAPTERVWVATSGERMVNEMCYDKDGYPEPIEKCVTTVDMMNRVFRDAWSKVRSRELGFYTGECGGEPHFIRKERLNYFKPDAGDVVMDTAIVWLRSKDSIDGEVTRALMLMVTFSVFIFIFDAFICFVEFYLIALPLKRLEYCIGDIVLMDLNTASDKIRHAVNTPVSVAQVRRLADGMMHVVDVLFEYKTFLPHFVTEQADLAAAGTKEVAVKARVEPPSGRELAIVFTDIKQSTVLWESHPCDMKTTLQMHNTIIRDCLATFDGYEVKTIGDAFMAAFDSAVPAVQFGLEVQKELSNASWPGDLGRLLDGGDPNWKGLLIRIGINCGEVDAEVNPMTGRMDYYGSTVNVASRVEGVGIGGCVAITENVLDALPRNVLAPGSKEEHSISLPSDPHATVIPMGRKRLKGVSSNVNVLIIVGSAHENRLDRVRKVISGEAKAVEYERRFWRDGSKSSLTSSTSVDTTRVTDARIPEFLRAKLSATTATVCRVNLMHSYDLLEENPHSWGTLGSDLGRLLSCAERSEGVLVSTTGTDTLIGWNTHRSCSAHFDSFLQFSLLATEAFSGTRKQAFLGACTGKVISGSVSTRENHRVSSITGPPPVVCQYLVTEALTVRARCLYITLNGATPRKEGLLRPVDTWDIQQHGTCTVFEVNVKADVQPNLFFGWEMVDSLDGVAPPSWSSKYWDAFFNKQCDLIASFDDPSLDWVASRLESPVMRATTKVYGDAGGGSVAPEIRSFLA